MIATRSGVTASRPPARPVAITTSLPGSHSDVEASLYLVIGQVPSDLTTMISIEEGEAEVVDWQRGSRLLEHVGLANIQIAENPTRAAGVRDQEFRERGYEILATGNAGPLVLARRSPTRSAYFLLFHTDHSTLPYRIGFPVLVKNSIDIALNEVGLAEVRGQATQILRARTLNADQEYRVTGPRGIDRQVHTDADEKSHDQQDQRNDREGALAIVGGQCSPDDNARQRQENDQHDRVPVAGGPEKDRAQ